MKKQSKRIIALITVIAILSVTVLTLGLVRKRQDNYFFSDYKYFDVYNLGTSYAFPDIHEKVAPALKSTSFSVLSAMLEGQFSYRPTIMKDSEGDPAYLTDSTIKTMAATAERYLLHFVYDGELRSITVSGQKYLYNRAFVFVQEGSGEIVEVRVIPYVLERIHDGDGDQSTEFYEIPDLRIKMRTSKLYTTIANAITEFSA